MEIISILPFGKSETMVCSFSKRHKWKLGELWEKFCLAFFPLYKITNLRIEVLQFQQKEKETFGAAWARFSSLTNSGSNIALTNHVLHHHFYHGLNKEGALHLDIASGGSFSHKLISEGKAILEKILENTPYTSIFDEFPKEENKVEPSPDHQEEIHATEYKIKSNPSNELVAKESPTIGTQPTLEDDEPHRSTFLPEIEDGLFEDFGKVKGPNMARGGE